MGKLKEITKIANNAIYFDDDSDFCTALWGILAIVNPDIFKDTDCPDLKYIDDED